MNATKLALLGGEPAVTTPDEQFPRFSQIHQFPVALECVKVG